MALLIQCGWDHQVAKLKGVAVHFSPTHELLLVSYDQGTTLFCRLTPDGSSIVQSAVLAAPLNTPATVHAGQPKGPCQWLDLVSPPLDAGLVLSLALDDRHDPNASRPATAAAGSSSGNAVEGSAGAAGGAAASMPLLAHASLLAIPFLPAPALAVCPTEHSLVAQPLFASGNTGAAAGTTATASLASRLTPGSGALASANIIGGGTSPPAMAAAAVAGAVSFMQKTHRHPTLMLLHTDGAVTVYACPVGGASAGGGAVDSVSSEWSREMHTAGSSHADTDSMTLPPHHVSSSMTLRSLLATRAREAHAASGGAPAATGTAAGSGGGGGGSSVSAGGSTSSTVAGGSFAAAASPEPRFPIDFFEWSTCVTPDVKLSGDFLRLVDADAARITLTTDDGFVEAPAAGTHRLTVRDLGSPAL
jgi:hypothetical protein